MKNWNPGCHDLRVYWEYAPSGPCVHTVCSDRTMCGQGVLWLAVLCYRLEWAVSGVQSTNYLSVSVHCPQSQPCCCELHAGLSYCIFWKPQSYGSRLIKAAASTARLESITSRVNRSTSLLRSLWEISMYYVTIHKPMVKSQAGYDSFNPGNRHTSDWLIETFIVTSNQIKIRVPFLWD